MTKVDTDNTEDITSDKNDVYHAPEWTKHVIWYQIFPERFRNGDPDNDPHREYVYGPEGWSVTSWTADWYAQTDWEKSLGDKFTDSIYHRRYGGDLQGIIDKLDYLQSLGIGGIYLNPIFDAVSLHKYDTSYYHHVDRFFGPDPKGDEEIMEQENPMDPSTWQWTSADRLFLKLIEEVHNRGMYIIIDGVFNHTGTEFWAFRDLVKHQEQSPFKDWYEVKSFRDEDSNIPFDYDGWWGHWSLPEFKEKDGTLIKPVREHIYAITRRWMDPDGDGDPSDGIDGWRLDVPEEIGKDFWREWNALVRDINPEAYTVGEIWTTKSKEWVSEDLFTAAMNYPFAKIVQSYMIDEDLTASEFLHELKKVRQKLPSEATMVMQNLMDSHDTPRLASMIVNPGREYNENGRPEHGFDVRKPTTEERRLQKLIALFQYTYIGAPMIFYGTEAGMWGAGDPDDRKPMVWPEFDYEPEKKHPLNKERTPDDNNFDNDLFSWYQRLGEIRNEHLAFQTGDFQPLNTDDNRNILAFARFLNLEKFGIVVINKSEEPQSIRIEIAPFELNETAVLKNCLTGRRVDLDKNEIELKLPPVSGAILMPEKQ
ncbi:glycoside hydrolase family 13 protein [Aliifodinibius salicampi]|uniref:Glycoside hydrolase family 13 protein n=1 Tax=Fodinibius salicampi TaxID=1920655 RepID=A0ABT3PVY1_9BACT|nr:glycoside hydrolase family 13 protein [Fodinibius salicampi]MCW9712017.1 glycoside hydrolase family 13 protein [Fodinibius salicampi]